MNFESLVKTIEQTHQNFQHQAVKAINFSLTLRNWLIGCYIVEFELKGEDRAIYGDGLMNSLANKLVHIKGIDRRSLFRYRVFYTTYHTIGSFILSSSFAELLPETFSFSEKVGSASPLSNEEGIVGTVSPLSVLSFQVPPEKVVHNLSYSHIEQLLNLEDDLKRTFYEVECNKGNWGVRELKRQINNLYYERSGIRLKPEKLSAIVAEKAAQLQPEDIVKSMYTCKSNQEGFQNLLGLVF